MCKMQYIVNFEMHKLLDMSLPCCDPTVKQTDQTVMHFVISTQCIKMLLVVNSDAVKVKSR